jgi:hypothetical protein
VTVTFLVSRNDLFQILLFPQEEPPLYFLEIWIENATAAFFENMICVIASAHRKLKGGVLETLAKRSIHHGAVKSAVRSSKAKVAYCMSLIKD